MQNVYGVASYQCKHGGSVTVRYITLLYNDTLTLPSAEGCNKISSPVSLWHQAYNNPQLPKETGNGS